MRSTLLAIVVVLGIGGVASAADRYWTGGTGDWDTDSYWGGTEPTSSDTAYITNGGTAQVTLPGETAYTLRLGQGTGETGNLEVLDGTVRVEHLYNGYQGTGSVSQSGGTTTVASSMYLGWNSDGNGSYDLSGGNLYTYDAESVGVNGVGVFDHSGGQNRIYDYSLSLGCYAGSHGTYKLSGSGVLQAPAERIGFFGEGVFEQSGGTNIVNGNVWLGYYYGSSGSYDLSGSGSLSAFYEYVGYGGTGRFTQSGGTNVARTALCLALASGSDGTYNLNGGVLSVAGLSQGNGTAAFNFGGGTLEARASFDTSVAMTLTGNGGNAIVDTSAYQMSLSGELSGPGGLVKTGSGQLNLAHANTYEGGTTLVAGTLSLWDPSALGTGGVTVHGGMLNLLAVDVTVPWLSGNGGTITTVSANPGTSTLTVDTPYTTTYRGSISDGSSRSIALRKDGTGTLRLTGINSYSGPTDVDEGLMVVNGSLDSASLVTVHDGGTLAGSGKVGSVVVDAGGHVAPGNSAGVLTLIGDLTLNYGALLDFDLDTPTTSDQIVATGTLSLDGLDLSDIDFTLYAGFGAGSYTLIDAASVLGSLGPEVSGVLGGFSTLLSVSGDDLILEVTGGGAVPEPAGISMLLAGLAALGLVIRRRR